VPAQEQPEVLVVADDEADDDDEEEEGDDSGDDEPIVGSMQGCAIFGFKISFSVIQSFVLLKTFASYRMLP
jgi:hypothetical protein